MQLHLQGLKNVDIARELGVTTVTVSRTLSSPIVREIVQRMLDGDTTALDVRTRLSNSAIMACEVIDNLMTDSEVSPAVRAQLAIKSLDRAGYAPVQKHAHVNSILSEEEIEAMCAAGKARGFVVDDSVEDANVVPSDVPPMSDRERAIKDTAAMADRLIAMSENR